MKRCLEVCKKIVQVGIRSLDYEEAVFAKNDKREIFWAKDIFNKLSIYQDDVDNYKADVGEKYRAAKKYFKLAKKEIKGIDDRIIKLEQDKKLVLESINILTSKIKVEKGSILALEGGRNGFIKKSKLWFDKIVVKYNGQINRNLEIRKRFMYEVVGPLLHRFHS